MTGANLLLWVALVSLQDNASQRATQLIEDLRSDDPEERDAAANTLVELGERVRPLIQKVVDKSSGEASAQARVVLARLDKLRKLSNYLKKNGEIQEQATDDDIRILVKRHPKQVTWSSYDSARITDQGLFYIAQHPSIRNLYLSNCTSISDIGVQLQRKWHTQEPQVNRDFEALRA